MFKDRHFWHLMLLVSLLPSLSSANELLTNGFVTAGFSQSDNEQPFQGTSDQANFSDLSLVGLQTSYVPQDSRFTFVAQMLARGERAWKVEAEWAYISVQFDSGPEVQAGKFRLPIFMISEFYDIGFAYPWIRPPEELYGFSNFPITAVNGIRFNQSFRLLGLDWQSQLYFGNTSPLSLPAAGMEIPLSKLQIGGIAIEIEFEFAKFRVGYHDGTNLSASLLGPISAASGISTTTLQNLGLTDINNGKATYSSMGFELNWQNLFFLGEFMDRKITPTVIPGTQNWFFTGGYAFGRLKPHLTYSVFDSKTVDIFNQDQRSLIAGIRFEISSDAAIKVEFSHSKIDDRATAVGLYDVLAPNISGGTTLDSDVRLVNFAVNMVF